MNEEYPFCEYQEQLWHGAQKCKLHNTTHSDKEPCWFCISGAAPILNRRAKRTVYTPKIQMQTRLNEVVL